MRAAVLLIGDELLAGHTRDANAHFLAQRLNALGHRLRRVSVVPDETHAIQSELDHLAPMAEIVFLSGGLGPTHDDRTTEAVAERFNRALVVDEPSWQKMVARYSSRFDVTAEMAESARKMVLVPEGVEVLDNPVGAACGYVLRDGTVAFVALPGVPAELQAIFEAHVVGKILPVGQKTGHVEVDVAMAEAAFAKPLGDIATVYADVEIGSYPHYGERRVTLRFKGEIARARAAMEAFFVVCPDAKQTIVRGPV